MFYRVFIVIAFLVLMFALFLHAVRAIEQPRVLDPLEGVEFTNYVEVPDPVEEYIREEKLVPVQGVSVSARVIQMN